MATNGATQNVTEEPIKTSPTISFGSSCDADDHVVLVLSPFRVCKVVNLVVTRASVDADDCSLVVDNDTCEKRGA